MKNYNLILILFLLVLNANSQNLVPNGSFETYTSCPTGPGQTNLATPWYDPTGASSDYFNACASVSSFVNVPDGTMGFWQYARSGGAYSGFWAMQNFGSEVREYIQVPLTTPMSPGTCYSITFYTNLMNLLKKGCNNIGAYVSATAVTTSSPNVLNFTPQILLAGNPAIVDTVNWTKISGLYYAAGGEQYLTIGNFKNDTNTVTQVIDASSPYDVAYYFIDDVSVVACADTGVSITEHDKNFNFKLYPNPVNDKITVQFELIERADVSVEIKNVLGQTVTTNSIDTFEKGKNQIEVDLSGLSPGLYLIQLHSGNKSSSRKIIKE